MVETNHVLTVDFYPKPDLDFVWEVVSVSTPNSVQHTVSRAKASLINMFRWAERFVIRRGEEVVCSNEVQKT